MEMHEMLRNDLKSVHTSQEFSQWTRKRLRQAIPHAALLCTLGRLYGMGSVPTHRLGVDFPFNLVEELKNGTGAIDDPSLYSWFESERVKCTELRYDAEKVGQEEWKKIYASYGMRSVLVHGVLDHGARRFALFQIFNPYCGGSAEALSILKELIAPMSAAAWATVNQRPSKGSRRLIGHPTMSLTRTELQIVELLAQGMSNKEIAKHRGVSDSTVKTQISRTGAKVGANRRAEIVAIAYPMLTTLPAQSVISYDE